MKRVSNATRISIGLTLVILSVMAGVYALGMVSRRGMQDGDQRLHLSQLMAVQFTAALEDDDPDQMLRLAESVLGHMPEIVSLAVRRADGSLLFASADHDTAWGHNEAGQPDTQQVKVPLYDGDGVLWGRVEVLFAPLPGTPLGEWGLFVLITVGCLLAFMLYMHRALREQDPTQLVQERVKAALDTLAEGALVIGRDDRIILANQAMGEILERDPAGILGTKACELDWLDADQDRAPSSSPWSESATGRACHGRRLRLRTPGGLRTLVVNVTPILGAGGHPLGVLAAFDDVTLLEEKNKQLIGLAQRLGEAHERVKLQNNELQRLAQCVGEVDREGFDLSDLLDEMNQLVDLCATPGAIERKANDPRANSE